MRHLCELDQDHWKEYLKYPLPGWGSKQFTLFDVPAKTLASEALNDVSVLSVPFDSTSSTRIGSRYGPMSIRKASLAYSAQQQSRDIYELYHMRTGKKMQVLKTGIVDYGDAHIFPTDPLKQIESITAEARRAIAKSERLLLLGGEHTISVGGYYGVANAIKHRSGKSLGYVQIDHHFDFGDQSILHGKIYHGSNGRRISEHPDLPPEAMGFVGVGDLTSVRQYDRLVASGVAIAPVYSIREKGFEPSLRNVLDKVTAHCDELYISIDIDVCDTSVATGTGHVTVGGINASEFLSMAYILQDYPVRALDIVEVSPSFDQSGATASLAARFLFEWLFLKEI